MNSFIDILEKEICIDEKNNKRVLLSGIEIPMIQRDYAQGRKNAKEVRNRFLSSIFEALGKEEDLTLDFIYGSINEASKFLILDGQQRLTTLFLLYWYIASRELSSEDKVKIMSSLSKFTYATRDSASRFCENLVDIKKTDTDEPGFFDITPQERLRNLPWFFLSYEKDPTIKSMFTMLDAIHEKYNESKNKPLFDSLQHITFYILPMNDFKLTDELYVKMNARGKQLTNFENFKADLIKWMKAENNPNKDIYNEITKLDKREIAYYMSFSQKIDNDWAKFFWTYAKTEEDGKDKVPDRFLLNFLNRYLFNLFVIESKDSPDEIQENDIFKYFYGDSGDDSGLTYCSFKEYQALFERKNIIHNIEKCLDCFKKHYASIIKDIAKAPWGNEWDFFQTKLDNLSQRVVFLAITLFIEKNEINDDFPLTQFKQWMRVVWNIVENTGDRIAQIIPAMRLINELSGHTKDIYAFLSNESNKIESGAAKEQIAEERQKAELIQTDNKWEKELIKAEKHPYFKGQIYFLLHIANKDLQQFILYRDKAISVFVKDKLEHENYFHRVLLALVMNDTEVSDYSIELSNNRWSFCKDEQDIKNSMLRHGNKDFYYELIKSLLDLVQSPETAYEDIENKVNSVEFDDNKWQTFFITTPHCFDYCEQKIIRWDEQAIYLISKSKNNSYQAELRTFYLWKKWIEQKKGQLSPFESARYDSCYNILSEQPRVVLDQFNYDGNSFKLDIVFQDGRYQFLLKSSDNKPNDMLLKIKNKLKIEGDNNHLTFFDCSTIEEAKKRIEEICELLL